MADVEAVRVESITAEELRRAVLDPDEIAVVDVREGDRYASGHISVAVELPFSEIELRAAELLPRSGVRIVVTDDDGASLAPAAAARLTAIGYQNVRVLAGGLRSWGVGGNELITGLNSLSKALGEFVERHYQTPKIGAGELHKLLSSGQDVIVLDTRPLEEFNHISIPDGIAAPGAELLHRVFDAVPSPTTQVVVNCAGRTRAIIGAQALLNAGIPNPVVSLENGTAAWLLAGLEPSRGATAQAGKPSAAGLAKAREAASRIAARFGVRTIDRALLDTFRSSRTDRTLYLFDVRTAEEFEAGHFPGALSAPGGQLVQATDRYVGVREGRIVLLDDPDLVRAAITASWLYQLGLSNVFIHPVAPADRTESGRVEKRILGDLYSGETIQPVDLAALIASGAVVLDLEAPPPYFRERLYIPGSIVVRRLTLVSRLDQAPGTGPIVLTSSDGALARLAAAELVWHGKRRVLALAGGTAGWIAAGLGEPGRGLDQPALDPSEALPKLPTLEQRRVTLAAYVHWGDVIVEQLDRDGLVQFRLPLAT
ncbi:rhodanese-like domain-containing protein [Acidisphaera sp. S103]|uniref:rhodanese-like domain-containing protein n=1 Tax=Acidisphaera sp. S103 TaxID=1747223 RepID=UPI00131AD066|nr:rhodanese-like domain-containing protein [Acidisphaera sp. S103]